MNDREREGLRKKECALRRRAVRWAIGDELKKARQSWVPARLSREGERRNRHWQWRMPACNE
ncbi:hypothetical protein Csa_016110 [Cucumis sativus]|uniref:Uncharacterized protein n=1 Tax=Cucumis sativus TaxID=3659 RepID=A0A0A0K6P9_CUCSA|nr:hypothetical protein Csa_016110 [Cucumis sativus]